MKGQKSFRAFRLFSVILITLGFLWAAVRPLPARAAEGDLSVTSSTDYWGWELVATNNSPVRAHLVGDAGGQQIDTGFKNPGESWTISGTWATPGNGSGSYSLTLKQNGCENFLDSQSGEFGFHYSICSVLAEPEYGPWSDWIFDPETGKEYQTSHVVVHDYYDETIVCDEWDEIEWRDVPVLPSYIYWLDCGSFGINAGLTWVRGQFSDPTGDTYEFDLAAGGQDSWSTPRPIVNEQTWSIHVVSPDGTEDRPLTVGPCDEPVTRPRTGIWARKTVQGPCWAIAATVEHFRQIEDSQGRIDALRTIDGVDFDKTCTSYGGPDSLVEVWGAGFRMGLGPADGTATWLEDWGGSDGYDGVASIDLWGTDQLDKSFGAIAEEFPTGSPFDWMAQEFGLSYRLEVREGTPWSGRVDVLQCPATEKGKRVYCGWWVNRVVISQTTIETETVTALVRSMPRAGILAVGNPYAAETPIGSVVIDGTEIKIFEAIFGLDGKPVMAPGAIVVFNGHFFAHQSELGDLIHEGAKVTIEERGNMSSWTIGSSQQVPYSTSIDGENSNPDLNTCFRGSDGSWAGIESFELISG